MITVAKLRRKPRHLQSFTGLSVTEFDTLLAHVTVAYEEAEIARQQRTPRQRQAGGGHPFRLDLPERLLMGLMYLRLYTCQSLLGYLFDLDESNISRELHGRLLPILLEVLPVPLRDAPLRHLENDASQGKSQDKKANKTDKKANKTDKKANKTDKKDNKTDKKDNKTDKKAKPRPRISTLQELFAAYPEIEEVLLDATEQSVPQPKNKRQRKLAYSGKQHDHTVKTQILATRSQILHVFGNLPGCLNDMLVLRASGVLRQVPPEVTVRLDKGYDGTAAAYPAVEVAQPIKKKPKQPQNILERAYNHLLSVRRIPVEHHFARLKKWESLSHLWRGRGDDHEDFFCVVAGLLNFRQSHCLELGG